MAERKFLYMDPTYGYHAEQDQSTDTIKLAGLTMSGNIAMASNKITGLAAPTDPGDAVTKTYADSLVSGLHWKAPVTVLNMIDDSLSAPPGTPVRGDAYVVGATPSGGWSGFGQGDIVEYDGATWNLILAASGAEPPDGTRVLVAATSATTPAGSFAGQGKKYGTYSAGTDTWTFVAAADADALLVMGDGSVYENSGYVYESATTAWTQFTGAGQITAGPGLYKDGNTIGVNFGDGVHEASDYVAIDLSASNPGLQLTGTTPNKTLEVLLKSASGLAKDGNGLYVMIDDTPDTLDVDGDGLKVVGLPSLFKINGTAVGATVTAPNLDTLTNTSNADSLHTHNIVAVDEAKRVEDTHLNNVAISAAQAVRWSSVNNEIIQADNSTVAGSRPIGVARTGGAGNPGTSEVVKVGVCASVLTGATVNNPYFLGAAGALVLFGSIPTPGWVVRLGYAKNATDLDVQIADYGYRR